MKKMDTLYLAAICAVGGFGRAKIMKLVQALGSARSVYEANFEQLMATGIVKEDAVAGFVSKRKSD